MDDAGRVPIDELLAHKEWVSRLAHRLAGPAGDDVAQDLWVAALRSPPDGQRPARPWLAEVLRNLVRLRRRGEGRRLHRERAAEALRPDHVEAVDEVYERVELQRFLAEQVMALDEPLRAVVVLRYVQDLDASRIGEIVGSPAGTVRWRLKEALDRLRAALDRRCGGRRRAWVAVLVPAALRPPVPTTTGALFMAKLKLQASLLISLLVLMVLAVSGALLWRSRSPATAYRTEETAAARGPGAHLAAGRLDPPAAPFGLAGVVLGGDARPVEGAVVLASLTPGEPPPPGRPPLVPAVRSDDTGHFQVSGLPPGRYVLTASKPDVGVVRSQPLDLIDRAVDGIVLTLGAARAGLSGRIVDAGGGPIPGARVTAQLTDRGGVIGFATVADPQGHYLLALPAGDFRFEVSADGYASGAFSLYLHLPMVHDFRLNPGSRLAGRVIARPDGSAVAGADVAAVPQGRGRNSRTTTGEDGRFVIADLAPGSYDVTARRGPLTGSLGAPVVLALAQSRSDLEVVIDRGRTVEGTVVADGVPVGGATVMASVDPPGVTRTDGEGRFSFVGLPSAALIVTASAPRGLGRARADATAADVRGLRVALSADAAVAGVVLDRDRRPAPNARVVATTGTGQDGRNTIGYSDQQGRFRIERLPPGPLSLAVTHEAGIGELDAGVLAAGALQQVEIVLAAGASVTGTVRREDGRPAPGAPVFALAEMLGRFMGRWPQPASATRAGPDGRYRIDGVPAGEVLLRALNAGDDPITGMGNRQLRRDLVPLVLRAGERREGVDLIVLRSDLVIRGRVLDTEGGPVTGAVLTAWPDGSYSSGREAPVLSQEDGAFAIDGLGPGRYSIEVSHADHSTARLEHIAAGASGVELRLARPGALAGVVTGPEGPASQYTIVARPVLGPSPTEHDLRDSWSRASFKAPVARPDGAFTFPSVPPGTYEITAYLADRRVASLAPLTIAPGERKTGVRLVAQPGVTIRGRVVDYRTGEPVVGARAEGRGTAYGQLTATTDGAGRFVLEGLAAGRLVDFAVVGPGAGYLTDCQHRLMPAKGTVDIGDVPLFPGPTQKLTVLGAAATGLWFHSQEGHPTVYSIMPGSPSDLAGARIGDPVLAVDDTDVRRLSSSVVEGLVATGGRTVRLTLQSPAGPRVVSVPRPEPGAASP
jgi:RNA polymerase sigma factor (sigma-70 family)